MKPSSRSLRIIVGVTVVVYAKVLVDARFAAITRVVVRPEPLFLRKFVFAKVFVFLRVMVGATVVVYARV